MLEFLINCQKLCRISVSDPSVFKVSASPFSIVDIRFPNKLSKFANFFPFWLFSFRRYRVYGLGMLNFLINCQNFSRFFVSDALIAVNIVSRD